MIVSQSDSQKHKILQKILAWLYFTLDISDIIVLINFGSNWLEVNFKFSKISSRFSYEHLSTVSMINIVAEIRPTYGFLGKKLSSKICQVWYLSSTSSGYSKVWKRVFWENFRNWHLQNKKVYLLISSLMFSISVSTVNSISKECRFSYEFSL